MFGLFKRTKIEEWEISLLTNTLHLLPAEFQKLGEQVDEGLFRGVLIGMGDIPNLVTFSFNPKVFSRFEQKGSRSFRISGIKIYDTKSKSFLNYTIYVSYGVISGYVIDGAKKYSIDTENIDVSNYALIFAWNKDMEKVSLLLDESIMRLVNPSDIYEVVLNGKSYYHLKDLEDGDFIGVDSEKRICKITHDPMEVTYPDGRLEDLFK